MTGSRVSGEGGDPQPQGWIRRPGPAVSQTTWPLLRADGRGSQSTRSPGQGWVSFCSGGLVAGAWQLPDERFQNKPTREVLLKHGSREVLCANRILWWDNLGEPCAARKVHDVPVVPWSRLGGVLQGRQSVPTALCAPTFPGAFRSQARPPPPLGRWLTERVGRGARRGAPHLRGSASSRLLSARPAKSLTRS